MPNNAVKYEQRSQQWNQPRNRQTYARRHFDRQRRKASSPHPHGNPKQPVFQSIGCRTEEATQKNEDRDCHRRANRNSLCLG
jgi:hypothetical protein